MKSKEISLILLVITIIVMLVIVGAIIISLTNSDIISRANKAVETTNLKSLQEAAAIASVEYRTTGQIGDKALYVRTWLIENGILTEQSADNYEFQEDGSITKKAPEWDEDKGVNKPRLAEGMIPIKWDNDGNIILTNSSDPEWYDYTNENWANVMLSDGTFKTDAVEVGQIVTEAQAGSMFVWIPRYEYKIPNPSTSTSQTIEVNFLPNKSITNTDLFIIHPAFTFDDLQLTGIWVSKFEASGSISSNTIAIKPNKSPLISGTIDTMFTACINLEANSRYGWDGSGSNIDTHLIKNIEWGACAYLSMSTYGNNKALWNNPLKRPGIRTTGRVGSTANDMWPLIDTPMFPYNNNVNGIKGSASGTVYGVYDMAGGAWEYTASYVDIGSTALNKNGASLAVSDNKYKDTYINYSQSENKSGDAIWETSTSGSSSSNTSWHSDWSIMPDLSYPFFIRGGGNDTDGIKAGTFAFSKSSGENSVVTDKNIGFRPVILVDSSL